MRTRIPTIVLLWLLPTVFTRADDKNTYINPTLGVTVVKPKDWRFATIEQHEENLGRVKLKDEEFQKLMQKYSTAPLVAMMKHPEPFDDLNPSFKMNIKPLRNLSVDDPKAILTLIATPLSGKFQDWKTIVPPKETTVGGRKAAYMKVHYSLEIPEGKSFPTCSEMWVVPRGKHFFLIGAGTRQDEKTGTREDIQKILASIKFD